MKKLNKISIIFVPTFKVMVEKVSTWGRTEMKIVWGIVQNIVVKMMNYLATLKKPPDLLLHNQPMFTYISVFSRIGVFRGINISVSVNNNLTTFPVRIFVSNIFSLHSVRHLFSLFFGHLFSF